MIQSSLFYYNPALSPLAGISVFAIWIIKKIRLSKADGYEKTLRKKGIGKTEKLDELTGFIEELRGTVDQINPRLAVAGQLAVSSDLVQEIRREGPKTTSLAFLAVVFLVVILFRSGRISVLLLVSLILGVGWLGGFMALFDIKINFVNFSWSYLKIGDG